MTGKGKFERSTNQDTIVYSIPFAILMEIEIKKVFAGPDHLIALGDYGRCYSLGTGSYGRLGLGDNRDRLKVCRITTLEPYFIIDVACGADFTVFLANNKP